MWTGYADVVFVPATSIATYVPLAEVFFKHHVWMEIAFPTILHALGVPMVVRCLVLWVSALAGNFEGRASHPLRNPSSSWLPEQPPQRVSKP